MPAAAPIDFSALPEDQRDAVAALLRENSALEQINACLAHLVAELTLAGAPVASCRVASCPGSPGRTPSRSALRPCPRAAPGLAPS